MPPEGYLSACAEICRRHNVLLICDEVQTGLGRTGRVLCADHEGVRPDALTLGKALGGGLMPVSLFLARREVMDVFGPGDHGSTFGGNPIACAVGHAALDVMVEEKLAERAAELGPHLIARLRAIASPAIREVRGMGLFAGVELDPHARLGPRRVRGAARRGHPDQGDASQHGALRARRWSSREIRARPRARPHRPCICEAWGALSLLMEVDPPPQPSPSRGEGANASARASTARQVVRATKRLSMQGSPLPLRAWRLPGVHWTPGPDMPVACPAVPRDRVRGPLPE